MKKQIKKKLTKGLAISMAFSIIFSTNAFATSIDVVNSTKNVQTDILTRTEGTDYFTDEENEWQYNEEEQKRTINEEVRVTVDLASQFTITIPKEIILDGENGTAQYKVKAVGDIAGDQSLRVSPDPSFILSENGGKADVTAMVTQPDTLYTYTELQGEGTEYDGNIQATLSAGIWTGKFNFNINFINTILPDEGNTLEEYSWAEIAAISEAGLAEQYFDLGDEKTITLGSSTANINTLADTEGGETYTVQILGFNHDDLSNDTGKAGITFGLKGYLASSKMQMNSGGSNAGGWTGSKAYSYLKNQIYPILSSDLRNVIKTVNKKTSEPEESKDILISKDKLFLLSEIEMFGRLFGSDEGEGEQYQYYVEGGKTSRGGVDCWLRSPSNDDPYCFSICDDMGSMGSKLSDAEGYIFFAFCV